MCPQVSVGYHFVLPVPRDFSLYVLEERGRMMEVTTNSVCFTPQDLRKVQ